MWRACTVFIHSTTGPVVHPSATFPSWWTRVQSTGRYLCKTGILLLELSRYIGDPNMIAHCGLVWGGLHPEASLGGSADIVIITTWSHTAFLSQFHARCRSSFLFHSDMGGALWRACNLTAFIHSSTGPVVHLFASRHEGPGFNWDSPVSIVSLQKKNNILKGPHLVKSQFLSFLNFPVFGSILSLDIFKFLKSDKLLNFSIPNMTYLKKKSFTSWKCHFSNFWAQNPK